jgi:hypothetical protein
MAKKLAQLGGWYVAQRLRSLATIYLTRRDDLSITEAPEEDGVDLIVTIHARNEVPQRKFGVVLGGTAENMAASQVNVLLKPTIEALSARPFPYPTCLFFFRMANDDAGCWTWVAEPVVTDEGFPQLTHRNDALCEDLDTSAIDCIVKRVTAWYGAFLANVVQGPEGRHKKNGIEVLHGIIDEEAAYFSQHGKAPKLLKLPIAQAFELAKLGREHLGDLAGHIIKEGVRVLEKNGLLGMKVKLTTDQRDFSLE